MNDQLKDNLIAAIHKYVSPDISLTTYLSDILNIGRESAYRRLRGEINFTFEEVVTLSKNLGFSIDNVIGIKQDENALFNIHMLQNLDYLNIYIKKMLEYSLLFEERCNLNKSTARMSINTLPYFFHVGYKWLSKFRIYKWLYQNQKITPNYKYADFILPDEVWEAHKTLAKAVHSVNNITLIMDQNIFRTVARDFEYFYKRDLLSKDDIYAMQAELHNIADMLEQMAISGRCLTDSKIDIYVSAVDLETSYLHFECNDLQFSQVRIYSISAIDSYDKGLCRIQKMWLESLKRFAVLISESGEMQRHEYMKQQRGYIDHISQFI